MKKSKNKASADQKARATAKGALNTSPVTLLHIDDDPNDTELFRAAARKAGVQFSIQNVADGEHAMAYLSGRGVYSNRRLYPLPSLVLLDLKMPRATGFDVLKWIRSHPEVGDLPVVVFSGSELQDDIQQAFAGGADSYLVKPIGFNALIALVKDMYASWVAGRLPRTPSWSLSAAAQTTWSSDSEWFAAGSRQARP
jgi:CheY-like chemotaxis protein